MHKISTQMIYVNGTHPSCWPSGGQWSFFFFYLGVTFIYNLNSNAKHLNALSTAWLLLVYLHQLLMINLPINISSKNSEQPQENSSICVVSRLVKSIGIEEVLYLQFIRFIKLWPGKVGTQKNESIADKRMAHSKSSCREGVGTLCINWHIVSLKEFPFRLQ